MIIYQHPTYHLILNIFFKSLSVKKSQENEEEENPIMSNLFLLTLLPSVCNHDQATTLYNDYIGLHTKPFPDRKSRSLI